MGRSSTHTPTPSLRPRSPLQTTPPPPPSLFWCLYPICPSPRTAPNGTEDDRERMRRTPSARPLGISARACDWKHTVNKRPLGMDAASRYESRAAVVQHHQYTWP
ncbi:hypothetical protein PBY51_017018 [Eleginops maclovinus]|uniref:Uncharacterized protein n=1 Tax=Eleginops maclovinus TaxID=56733 RepID=A0AAN7WST0_ELEMC|nr:hypothetical protein PBY51_017018 [Eleginops maclovinus]